MQELKKYSYDGPVCQFDRCVAHRWRAETYAVSKEKARSNMIYQFKKANNLLANTKISLPGEVVMEVE